MLFTQPLEQTLEQMELMSGPSENRMVKNVAAMMFCEHPEKFFPYTRVEIVSFPEGKINNPQNFTETTIKGSVPQIIKQTMDYLRTKVLYETVQKVAGRAEAKRFWNYPYDALEEAVVNSLYHRDYSQYEPVEITIEPDGIYILNCPGPDRSIPQSAIEKGDNLKSRRYRNRRLGDFLKELGLTEGRSTGVPTIQEKLADNGSPRATFETTEERLTFLIHIPSHPDCGNKPVISEQGLQLDNSEKNTLGSEKSSEKTVGAYGMVEESNKSILDAIRQNANISAAEIAMSLGISSRTVEKRIRFMRENGIIRRVGPDKGGSWEILLK